MKMNDNKAMIIILFITIIFIAISRGQISWLENHQSLGLIDDGKVHDRIVWVPSEMRSKFCGRIYFDMIPEKDKAIFIDAMNHKDYQMMEKIFDKYRKL